MNDRITAEGVLAAIEAFAATADATSDNMLGIFGVAHAWLEVHHFKTDPCGRSDEVHALEYEHAVRWAKRQLGQDQEE